MWYSKDTKYPTVSLFKGLPSETCSSCNSSSSVRPKMFAPNWKSAASHNMMRIFFIRCHLVFKISRDEGPKKMSRPCKFLRHVRLSHNTTSSPYVQSKVGDGRSTVDPGQSQVNAGHTADSEDMISQVKRQCPPAWLSCWQPQGCAYTAIILGGCHQSSYRTCSLKATHL